MKKVFCESFPHFLHGGDYNPEQWLYDKKIWDADMRLMRLANCNEMSVGIFSWAILEPREGEYDFSFLDEILDKIYAAGGRAFLATPSGARPRWMAKDHPEVLRVNNVGERNFFGKRHNHCLTSPYYRAKVAEMDARLAERYSSHPAVIGWHISNEFSGECFCESCKAEFREWLKRKYNGDIEKLNFQWWTTFWSHNYASFDDVEPPSPKGDEYSALVLDWRRFITDTTNDFIRLERDAIRRYSTLPVTANFMYRFTGLNYSKMHNNLDVISWDNYPRWHNDFYEGDEGNIRAAVETAIAHDSFRALKQKPFLLMESTPSNTNWQGIAKLKRPGMHKLSSLQAVAHGSDSVMYFQWRKSRGSDEKLHGAVVDHEGSENTRVFREVAELGATLGKIEDILGTMPRVRVAVVYDFENQWALENVQGFCNSDKKYYDTCYSFYYQLWKRGIDADVISAEDDFSRYDLVFAPMLYSVSEKVISSLASFVRAGGVLVSSYASFVANENDLCYLGGIPAGKLREVFGIWCEETDSLYSSQRNAALYGTEEFELLDYCDIIHPEGADVLATYRDDFYAGYPALTVNKYGEGEAYYLAARDSGALTERLVGELLDKLGIKGNLESLPFGVTAHARYDGDTKYLFVENYTGDKASVNVPPSVDLECGEELFGEIVIPAYGIKILRCKNDK